jgi:D-alanyl-D-alanine carboxypeptidase
VSRLALVVVLALALVAPGSAGAQALSPELGAQVDALAAAQMQSSAFPGLVVGLVAPGRGTYLKAYGAAALADNRPMAAGDRFRIGSVTKTFTATVILRLVEQGRLHLRDRLARWYPRVRNSRLITIRMLLNHSSGIPEAPNRLFAAWVASRGRRVFTAAEMIRAAARLTPKFRPGHGYFYSNTDYTLLGQIAERVSGRSIDTLYRRWVIDPLHLRQTAYRPDSSLPLPNARGYLLAGSERADTTDWSFSWAGTAGGMTSTVPDLLRYGPALATGRGLLTPAMQRRRLLDAVDSGQSGLRYGLGIFTVPIEVAPGRFETLVGHDGEVAGYNAIVFYSPTHRATFVVLGNTSPSLDFEPDLPGATQVLQLAAEVFATLY